MTCDEPDDEDHENCDELGCDLEQNQDGGMQSDGEGEAEEEEDPGVADGGEEGGEEGDDDGGQDFDGNVGSPNKKKNDAFAGSPPGMLGEALRKTWGHKRQREAYWRPRAPCCGEGAAVGVWT